MEILAYAKQARLLEFAPRMQKASLDVRGASTPDEMARRLREGREPDLVVVDREMPHIRGRDVLQEIVANSGGAAILIEDLDRITPQRVADLARAPLGRGGGWKPGELAHLAPDLHDASSGRVHAGKVAEFFGLSQAALARLLGRSPQAVHKAPDSASLQAGLRVFVRVATALLALFGTAERARVWLHAPHPDLDGVAPFELIMKKKAHVVAELLEDALLGQPG